MYGILLTLLLSHLGFSSERQALPFDLIKNGVTVLPTQVNYSVRRTGEITIAESTLSRETFGLKVQGEEIVYRWPTGIFENPVLELTSEKTSFNLEKPSAKDIKTSKKVDRYSDEMDSEKLLGKKLITFCVSDNKATPSARICSEPYNFKGGKLVPAKKKFTAKSLINKNKAGAKGSISVTPGGKPLNFSLTSPTGFSFDSELKIERREFLDMKQQGGKFLMKYRKESDLRSLPPRELELDQKNPFVVVKEPGQVPMIQEMIIRSIVPDEKDKIYFADANVFETYSSIVRIRLKKDPDVKLVPVDGTTKQIDEDEIEWQLQDLKTDESRKAYLSIVRDDQSVMSYADVRRHRAFEIGANVTSFATTGTEDAQDGSEVHLNLRFGWWFDDLFRMRVSWLSWQRWGYELDLQSAVASPLDQPQQFLLSTVKYRLNRGIRLFNPTIGLKSTFQLITEGDVTASAIGVGFFTESRAPSWIAFLTKWLFDVPHWILIDTMYYVVTIDAPVTLDQLYEASIKYKYLLTEGLDLDLSYRYKVDRFQVGKDKEFDSTIGMAMIGMAYRF